MMRSLFSGVSGLRNHQIRMDVIGNNVANVNTVGYKRARANFQEMLVQTLRGASAPQAGRGGTNPQQVGLGVNMGSIDTIFTQGSLQATGKVTDLAIQGDGFFVLSDGTGAASNRFYTRAGNFDLDRDGNLVDKSSGLKVMGYSVDDAGNVNTSALIPVSVLVGSTFPPKATTSITYGGNLDAGATIGSSKDAPIDVYDAQGTLHRVIANFKKTNNNEWQYTISFDRNSPLMQEYISAYYPSFDSMAAADQQAVLDHFNNVLLGYAATDLNHPTLGGYASACGIGSNVAGLHIEAKSPGTGGNSISITLVKAGSPNSPTTVSVSGTDITVTLGTDASNNINATFNDIKTAIEGDAAADALVRVDLDPTASWSTVATTEATTFLKHGSTSVRTGTIIFSASGIVDTDATRAANGATAPNLTKSFIFQPTGTNPVEIVPDISSLTQYNSAFTVLAKKQNGNPSGTLQSLSISKNGRVSGVFSNGFTKEMAALALAVFNNPGGLFKIGDNLYQPSVNSGTEQIGTAETGGRGTVVPGTLEMSNVDLAQEFTDMIITQRGFQANTRVITTSDEMLQELANLKR